MTNSQLIQNLDRILKSYDIKVDERKLHIANITAQFCNNRSFLKYPLDTNTFLILTKDERKVKHLRRFKNSPFPLLSNLEKFVNTVGSWNLELEAFGIKTRLKINDPTPSELKDKDVGTQIHLVCYQTANSKGNHYLKRQYLRLKLLRKELKIQAYWDLSWNLMRRSISFRTACLSSWQPRWYKQLSSRELQSIWKTVNNILNLNEVQTAIKNVWIESPKDKWRQLGIPCKGWRLYLHMLNMFLTYIYEPSLPLRKHEGFIFGRGCKSWWEDLLWGNLLTRFENIMEVDLSSGFPNLNRLSVWEALRDDGLLPIGYINLILTHLCSPLQASDWFPTVETLIENDRNKLWRKGNRSVHMGLGISPILFVITLDWAFRKIKLSNPELEMKWYADDGSFYYSWRGLYSLIQSLGKDWIWIFSQILEGQNLFLSLLNDVPLFKQVGIKFCPKKSSLVRIMGIWLKPFSSLGLKLYTSLSVYEQLWHKWDEQPIPLDLMGWTRGRGANPVTGKKSTMKSRRKLAFDSRSDQSKLNLVKLLKEYRNYFGLIMAQLYNAGPSSTTSTRLMRSLKTNSLLWHCLIKQRSLQQNKLGLKLDLYNSGGKLIEAFQRVNTSQELSPKWHTLNPNIERLLKVEWPCPPASAKPSHVIYPFWEKNLYEGYDYFNKYSELNLTGEELARYQQMYEAQKERPSRAGVPRASKRR